MIYSFTGKFKFLSNFSSVSITLDGIEYPSSEHAYQSAKSDDPKWKKICEDPLNTSAKIKQLSRSEINVTDDFNKNKLAIMERCLRAKFSHPTYKEMLIETGDQNIVEGNNWGDTFWGVDIRTQPNYGKNYLGRLLMKIRQELQD